MSADRLVSINGGKQMLRGMDLSNGRVSNIMVFYFPRLIYHCLRVSK